MNADDSADSAQPANFGYDDGPVSKFLMGNGDAEEPLEDDQPELQFADPMLVALNGLRVAFVGKLGGVSKREAIQIVRRFGGTVVDLSDRELNLVITGAEVAPLMEAELIDEDVRHRVARGEVEVIHETEFWQRLGLDEAEHAVKRLYTPAMLADLLQVPVSVIRRWHRRGLIIPVRTVLKLPYFDFTEVSTARRLAELVAAGASPEAIERRLDQLSAVLPDVERPLAQLSVLIEGKQILLRQGEGLIEPGGQLRIDFEALESTPETGASEVRESILAFSPKRETGNDPTTAFPMAQQPPADEDPLLAGAYDAEDAGELELAVDFYHAVLARDGARADICFQLGELLYRIGQVDAARERYYMAIELDEAFVEARASLGCVLAELGRKDLAIAAFQGALKMHDDYPDVHYNLARTLDAEGMRTEAIPHWERFLALCPESPWADEARQRIAEN